MIRVALPSWSAPRSVSAARGRSFPRQLEPRALPASLLRAVGPETVGSLEDVGPEFRTPVGADAQEEAGSRQQKSREDRGRGACGEGHGLRLREEPGCLHGGVRKEAQRGLLPIPGSDPREPSHR